MNDVSMREQMASTLLDLLATDERLVVVLADISSGYFSDAETAYPNRVINVGIMEQTAVSLAAGYAIEGFIPVFHSIAPFAVERPYEQWKDDFGYQQLGGNVISIGASYDYGTDGTTHHAPADVSILRTIPGMEVVIPGSAAEFDSLFRQSYADGWPTYFRLAAQRNEAARRVRFGRLAVERRGGSGLALAVGPMLDRVLDAADGLDVSVAYLTTAAPFDAAGLKALSTPGRDGAHRILLVEPYLEGTLVDAVVDALRPDAVHVEAVGVPRRALTRYGSLDEHDAEAGLTTLEIRRRLERLLAG